MNNHMMLAVRLLLGWTAQPRQLTSALWLDMNAGMNVNAADDTTGPVKGPV